MSIIMTTILKSAFTPFHIKTDAIVPSFLLIS
ncbi:hypothetical protein CAEBREN_01868 [Caenorhabditis brenneri]|uniref:Uncharacterized protein n=1 Tax=Caenorhabditis brenneri TaxID=135651 RepID=G0N2V3_CAEBE|nr:hypothetical protein CAEBREN_01868 [Caenorhabditis brenneri]